VRSDLQHQEEEPEVRAGGGVIMRRTGGGDEVAVIHRPKYEDWSLPKGKLEPGESWEDAALREVEEETGFRCRLDAELPPNRYEDRHGRDKLVRYWAMAPEAGEFAPNEEVDELRWLPVGEALDLLTYAHDRTLVEAAAERFGD
jgi:8-oxo-dGTP diphosphatase